MSGAVINAILVLCGIGLSSAIILYFVARKFRVEEDPRVDTIEKILPGANCGACGFPGCRAFADNFVKADKIDGLYCPVGGSECIEKAAAALGKAAPPREAMVAVLRCNGTRGNRKATNIYDSSRSCAIMSLQYIGETGCPYGCLRQGDCVRACKFDAIRMDEDTGLPAVDEDACIACGACVDACPNEILELRKKGPEGRRVYVRCINLDRGGVAIKNCKAACIACGKCEAVCPSGAVKVVDNLAYVNFELCTLCRECAKVCPTKAINEANFPPAVIKEGGAR
jgi:Na+-translocating ferredoxin:NAD+ oxidoreductase subunit B